MEAGSEEDEHYPVGHLPHLKLCVIFLQRGSLFVHKKWVTSAGPVGSEDSESSRSSASFSLSSPTQGSGSHPFPNGLRLQHIKPVRTKNLTLLRALLLFPLSPKPGPPSAGRISLNIAQKTLWIFPLALVIFHFETVITTIQQINELSNSHSFSQSLYSRLPSIARHCTNR